MRPFAIVGLGAAIVLAGCTVNVNVPTAGPGSNAPTDRGATGTHAADPSGAASSPEPSRALQRIAVTETPGGTASTGACTGPVPEALANPSCPIDAICKRIPTEQPGKATIECGPCLDVPSWHASLRTDCAMPATNSECFQDATLRYSFNCLPFCARGMGEYSTVMSSLRPRTLYDTAAVKRVLDKATLADLDHDGIGTWLEVVLWDAGALHDKWCQNDTDGDGLPDGRDLGDVGFRVSLSFFDQRPVNGYDPERRGGARCFHDTSWSGPAIDDMYPGDLWFAAGSFVGPGGTSRAAPLSFAHFTHKPDSRMYHSDCQDLTDPARTFAPEPGLVRSGGTQFLMPSDVALWPRQADPEWGAQAFASPTLLISLLPLDYDADCRSQVYDTNPIQTIEICGGSDWADPSAILPYHTVDYFLPLFGSPVRGDASEVLWDDLDHTTGAHTKEICAPTSNLNVCLWVDLIDGNREKWCTLAILSNVWKSGSYDPSQLPSDTCKVAF